MLREKQDGTVLFLRRRVIVGVYHHNSCRRRLVRSSPLVQFLAVELPAVRVAWGQAREPLELRGVRIPIRYCRQAASGSRAPIGSGWFPGPRRGAGLLEEPRH